jgi:hypothetical protein
MEGGDYLHLSGRAINLQRISLISILIDFGSCGRASGLWRAFAILSDPMHFGLVQVQNLRVREEPLDLAISYHY